MDLKLPNSLVAPAQCLLLLTKFPVQLITLHYTTKKSRHSSPQIETIELKLRRLNVERQTPGKERKLKTYRLNENSVKKFRPCRLPLTGNVKLIAL